MYHIAKNTVVFAATIAFPPSAYEEAELKELCEKYEEVEFNFYFGGTPHTIWIRFLADLTKITSVKLTGVSDGVTDTIHLLGLDEYFTNRVLK